MRHWRLMTGLPAAAALLAAATSLAVPPRYKATATFVPEGESTRMSLPGGVSAFAAQLGVAIPGGGRNSPQFYAEVLRSRTLLDQVLLARFSDPRTATTGDSATLLEILNVRGNGQRERIERGRRLLLKRTIAVSVDPETAIVTVSTETRYRDLSADVTNLLVGLLNSFNLESRQSNAKQQRQFVEERVTRAQTDLRDSEEQLKEFLDRNRTWTGSPELAFRHERLQRQVVIKEEVYTTLQRLYEEARIQEVNDMPVVTVIDHAVAPEKRSAPRRKLNVLLAFVLASVLAVFAAFAAELSKQTRESDNGLYSEFSANWTAIKVDLRSLLALGRPRGSAGASEKRDL
jgi:uncharacterized protein involved in exopolysaccharide biosynthesis